MLVIIIQANVSQCKRLFWYFQKNQDKRPWIIPPYRDNCALYPSPLSGDNKSNNVERRDAFTWRWPSCLQSAQDLLLENTDGTGCRSTGGAVLPPVYPGGPESNASLAFAAPCPSMSLFSSSILLVCLLPTAYWLLPPAFCRLPSALPYPHFHSAIGTNSLLRKTRKGLHGPCAWIAGRRIIHLRKTGLLLWRSPV